MKLKSFLAAGMVSIWASNASAQVVSIGFGAPQSVPISPWVSALMAVMVAVAAVAFLRKRIGSSAFLLMLSVLVGGVALKAEDSVAVNLTRNLTLNTSPAVSENLGFNTCTNVPYSASTLDVTSNVNTVITNISVVQGTPLRLNNGAKDVAKGGGSLWAIDPSSTCQVGTALPVNGTCKVYLSFNNNNNCG